MRQYIFSIILLILFLSCDDGCSYASNPGNDCNNRLFGTWQCVDFSIEDCEGVITEQNNDLTWKFLEASCDSWGSWEAPKWRIYDSGGMLADSYIECSEYEFDYCNSNELDGCNSYSYLITGNDNMTAIKYKNLSTDPPDCLGSKYIFILEKSYD